MKLKNSRIKYKLIRIKLKFFFRNHLAIHFTSLREINILNEITHENIISVKKKNFLYYN